MAFDSFREFVQHLDRAGELVRISQPVATELGITELADRELCFAPEAASSFSSAPSKPSHSTTRTKSTLPCLPARSGRLP